MDLEKISINNNSWRDAFESRENLIENIRDINALALQKAFVIHEELDDLGIARDRINQFGEMAVRGDYEAEEAVLNYLRKISLPIIVQSEEHGLVDIGAEGGVESEFFAVLDGIDGSSNYISDRGSGKYGTMFSIFDGTDPTYGDYISSGVLEHSTGKLYLASKNNGSFIIYSDGRRERIKTSGKKSFGKEIKIYADECHEEVAETFSTPLHSAGFETECVKASCFYYMAVADSRGDFALECTRKLNLEIAAAYGLIVESGGVIADMNGDDLRDRKYKEFGHDDKQPIVTAATQELAAGLISFLKNTKQPF